jgi:TonB family protein
MSRFFTALLISSGLCLGQTFPQQAVRITQDPESRQKLERELAAKLQQDPQNVSRLLEMGEMKREDAAPLPAGDARESALDEAQLNYERVVAIESTNITALYNLGVIGWMRVNPELRKARTQLSMTPETPGPLRDRDIRAVLNGKYGQRITDAIASLERVVALDPQNNYAMGYLNLVYRAKADLEDTPQAAAADIATAEGWVNKTLDIARARYAAGTLPPPPSPGSTVMPPGAIRVSGNMQAANLIQKVEPVYPPLALQARIQGIVKFNATIAKDGTIANLQIISGHPMLVQSAVEAAKKWLYKPTLLNGEPVEVVTNLDVEFALPTGN